jgi:hypothetical protein
VSQVVLDCKFIFHRQSICFIMTEPWDSVGCY